LLQILCWKPEDGGRPPSNRDVNEAAKNVVMMDLAILQAEAAAGMYKKPVEILAKDTLRAIVTRSSNGCYRSMGAWRSASQGRSPAIGALNRLASLPSLL
jgi:hypothetical protein